MSRPLTREEIEDILCCVKSNPRIPEEIDNCNKENVRNIMRKQLSKVKIYPSKIPALKEEMEKYYIKTQVSAGEMVGVLAATSIGEPTTQLALNSFHSSGISKSSMTTGVPRMQALLNTYKSKDDAGMYLYLKDVDNTNIKDIRSCCMSNYEYRTLKDVITSLKVVEVKNIKEEEVHIAVKNHLQKVFLDGIKKNGLMSVNYQKKYLVVDLNFLLHGKRIIHIVVLQKELHLELQN